MSRSAKKELRNRLNNDPERFLRLVHEGPEILRVTGQQMGCAAGSRSLKDGPVLLCECGGKRQSGAVLNEMDPPRSSEFR